MVSKKKHLSNEALRGRLGIDCVLDLVRQSRLRWFGHVERKDDKQWVKKYMDLKVDVSAGTGKYRKSWLECGTEIYHIIGPSGDRLFIISFI